MRIHDAIEPSALFLRSLNALGQGGVAICGENGYNRYAVALGRRGCCGEKSAHGGNHGFSEWTG
jgi:hypothetical protein